MRTRNIVLLIIIIILVLFGILFLSDKISDSGLDNINDCEDNKCVEGFVAGFTGFVEDSRAQRVVLFLPNRVAEIKQGKKLVMAFGIKNVIKEQKFRWEIKVHGISRKCGVREQEAERWVTTGRVGRAEIASGQKYSNFATFNIPEGSVSDISTCIIRYKLVILEEDGGVYRVEPFDVDIV